MQTTVKSVFESFNYCMLLWSAVQSSILFFLYANLFTLSFSKAIQSKQKSIILWWSDSIPPSRLFVSSLWFFSQVFIGQYSVPAHKPLYYSYTLINKQTKKNQQHNCNLNSIVNAKLSLKILLLVLILFNTLAEFWFKKCVKISCVWSKRTLLSPPMLKHFVCLFNFCLSTPAEPSEDGRQQKERSPPDHTSARTPPSTPIKVEEGMFSWFGGQGKPVTASLVTDAWKYMY